MFSQDDRTDGILQTTHSTPHEAGGRPSPLRAAAAAPRPRAAAACPAPGHGDTGGTPWSPAGAEGGAIRTPLTSHSLPQILFGQHNRSPGQTDRQTSLGPLPPSAQSQAPRHGVQGLGRRSASALQQRVSPAGGTASSAPGAWHSLIILSLARSANAFPASRLLSLGCVRSAGAL